MEISALLHIPIPELQADGIDDQVIKFNHVRFFDFSGDSRECLRQDGNKKIEHHNLNKNRRKKENAPLRKIEIIKIEFTEC